jgi:hypothetical protein
MPLTLGNGAAGLAAAAVMIAPIAVAAVAAADPVWPWPGGGSAGDTISDLEARGYNVQINWVSGDISMPLSQCSVSAIHNPDRSPDPQSSFTTVYVDVACPDDNFGGGVGIGGGAGIGFGIGSMDTATHGLVGFAHRINRLTTQG